MSNVVINNRNIPAQKIFNITNNRVILPFNVRKDDVNKLQTLLSKVKVTFASENDKLNINNLSYNNLNIKSINKNLNNCRFTLSKTYVVTMRRNFMSKVKAFYARVIEQVRPIFNIGKEVNLQEALDEATREINLSEIKDSLKSVNQEEKQVLANSPLGEVKIENPINLNQPKNLEQTQIIEKLPEETLDKPKVLTKKPSKGTVLIVPVIVIWLGIVFMGTVKLVTSILA